MRTIRVSTDVFARIWALRQPEEDTEDAVLRRVLGCAVPAASSISELALPLERCGVYDRRFGVYFPDGFELFRIYLGTEFRATVKGDRWVLLNDGRSYSSLNELSRAVGAKTENAWLNWFYFAPGGERRPASDLRDPSRITPRKRPTDLDEAKLDMEVEDQVEAGPTNEDERTRVDETWRGDVVEALRRLRGRAPLHRIYTEVEEIRKRAGKSLPRTLDAIVRRTLEDHSSDSENYRGGRDLFCMPEGRGAGIWALR